MKHRSVAPALALALAFGLCACSGMPSLSNKKKDTGLNQVDDLLSRVERVQVESVVSKERARKALETLLVLISPEFRGDATASYQQLVQAIDASDAQAKKLAEAVEPMKRSATAVFERWTRDLESFGNTRMRARSQERMAQTRTRYEAVLSTAVSAQIAYGALNADLRDHALFLGHDLNASAVGEVAGEVAGLTERALDLGARLDACAAAARSYVESSALYGQLEPMPEVAEAAPEPAPKTTARATQDAPAARRTLTLQPATPPADSGKPVQNPR